MYSSAAHISLRQGCRSPVPLSDASFPTHSHDAAPLYRRRRRRRHPHVVEYLRRDTCPLIRKVVTSLIHDHFGLEFASDSAYLSLLFCRLFHLFFESVRCVLGVFRSTVVAEMLPLTVFTPRCLGSYCVMSDFESGFSGLRMLTACFEDHFPISK